MKTFLLSIAFALALPAAGAGLKALTLHRHKIFIEIAATPEARSKGLMFRTSLPTDHGMLFVFPDSAVRLFWMKDTLIPLDIAFLDSRGKIVAIKSMKPLSTELVTSEKPSVYALETNRGLLRKLHARVGDTISGLLSITECSAPSKNRRVCRPRK